MIIVLEGQASIHRGSEFDFIYKSYRACNSESMEPFAFLAVHLLVVTNVNEYNRPLEVRLQKSCARKNANPCGSLIVGCDSRSTHVTLLGAPSSPGYLDPSVGNPSRCSTGEGPNVRLLLFYRGSDTSRSTSQVK